MSKFKLVRLKSKKIICIDIEKIACITPVGNQDCEIHMASMAGNSDNLHALSLTVKGPLADVLKRLGIEAETLG